MMASPTPAGTFIHTPLSIVQPLNLKELFPADQPVELELGSGDGSFLANYAKAHPEHNFIGVERLLGRLRKVDRKGLRAGLTNLCLVRLEASYLLKYMVPAGALSALHVYFPDPWPKRKHRKNRLINEDFVATARKSLAPGGIVFLRTDDQDYFSQMTAVFGSAPEFQVAETPESLSSVVTDFERNFLLRGVKTLRSAYQLRSK